LLKVGEEEVRVSFIGSEAQIEARIHELKLVAIDE